MQRPDAADGPVPAYSATGGLRIGSKRVRRLHAALGYMLASLVATTGCVGRAPLFAPAAVEQHEAAPSGPPELRLSTAMHTSAINSADVDPHERFLVTGSDDKTARVWSLADGALLQTLRLPSEGVPGGRVYAVAISPDGERVAAAGYTEAIFVFRRQDGRLLQRIDGLPSSVVALRFAPGGAQLVAGCGSGGIRVFARADGTYRQVAEDADYAGEVFGLAFDPSGRLATASYDRKIRLYDASFSLIASRALAQRPFRLAYSADGQRLAVGSADRASVELMRADLVSLASFDLSQQGVDALSSVAWLGSERFVAGGMFHSGREFPLVVIDPDRGGVQRWPGLSETTIGALAPLASGELVLASMEPRLTRLSVKGAPRWTLARPTADLQGQERTLALSADGRHVRFGLAYGGKRPVVYPAQDDDARAPISWHEPSQEGLPITGWEGSTQPVLDGTPLALDANELSRSLAVTVDAQRFVLGTEWSLRMYTRGGQALWRCALPSLAWAVNISEDGRLVVAGLGDGTVRWYRATDGALLLSLFHHPARDEWVAWTPEGFFEASEHGESLIGYQFNRGRDGTPVFLAVSQLSTQFHRPDLVALSLLPDRHGLTRAAEAVGNVAGAVAQGLPPRIEIVSTKQAGDVLHVYYRLHDQGGGIGQVRFRVNDTLRKPVEGARVVGPQAPQGQAIYEQPLSLPPGESLVAILALNASGNLESTPAELSVRVAEAPKPTLHILSVGVTHYDDHGLRKGVKFAAQDAQRVADALRTHAGRLYAGVKLKVLPDATHKQIQTEFARLAKDVRAHDVFVLYLAGHGLAGDDGIYRFVPRDVLYENDAALAKQSLNESELASMLAAVPATKSLVLLDSCHAGAALETRASDKATIARFMRITGRATFAASSDTQYALEGIGGKSAFVHVLLQGLAGAANRRARAGEGDDWVDVDELGDYLMDELPKQTFAQFHYRQVPMRETHGGNFPVSDTVSRR